MPPPPPLCGSNASDGDVTASTPSGCFITAVRLNRTKNPKLIMYIKGDRYSTYIDNSRALIKRFSTI